MTSGKKKKIQESAPPTSTMYSFLISFFNSWARKANSGTTPCILSQLQFLSVWPWADHLASLSLSYTICYMQIIMVLILFRVLRIKIVKGGMLSKCLSYSKCPLRVGTCWRLNGGHSENMLSMLQMRQYLRSVFQT